MARSRLLLPLLAALAVPLVTTGVVTPAVAKNNTAAAIVGGIIAGAAVGAAISNADRHPNKIYVQPPPPPPPDPKPFKVAPNVTCYPLQRYCYNASGSYNATWSWKLYGR